MRVKVDWRSGSSEQYKHFCKENPDIKISKDEWLNIIYSFSDMFRTYLLETGKKGKLPGGLGEFAVSKKKRKLTKRLPNGKEVINLAIDWKRTKQAGKVIYHLNYHTGGYFFGWKWLKRYCRLSGADLWYFKPCRSTSRLIKHYIATDEKYQHLYLNWK